MSTTMTKYKAEQLLGLEGTYDYKAFSKAYRSAVKVNHPDMGGDADKMIEINAAKKYLECFFDDKNATVTCSTSEFGVDNKAADDAYRTAQDVADIFNDMYEDDGYEKDVPFYEGSDYAKKPQNEQTSSEANPANTTSNEGAGSKPFSMEVDDSWNSNSKGGFEVIADAVTGKSCKQPDIIEAPAWYNILNKVVNHFPSRILFWVIAGIWANTLLMGSPSGDDYVTLTILALLTLVNVIFPILAPVRGIFRCAINAALRGWASAKGVSFDWSSIA